MLKWFQKHSEASYWLEFWQSKQSNAVMAELSKHYWQL